MATNPNNAVGTNGAYGGRTSVNALNDILSAYTAGIVNGWGCVPNSGLTVSLGGNGTDRDVAIAEDNSGNKTTINNISGSPINVTLDAAPGSNSRIDLVVAYVDNPPQGQSTEVDNPGACGIIKVTGTAGVSPIAPNDTAIRAAITADGASGVTAYYVILAQITIASGTTDIVAGDISQSKANIPAVKNITDFFNFNTFTDPTINISGGKNISSSNSIHCVSNADGSLGKIYGSIAFDTTGSNATVTFQTPLRPSSNLTINGIAWGQWSDGGSPVVWSGLGDMSFTLSTSGLVTVSITGSVANRGRRIIFIASLIFAKDFGDTAIQ